MSPSSGLAFHVTNLVWSACDKRHRWPTSRQTGRDKVRLDCGTSQREGERHGVREAKCSRHVVPHQARHRRPERMACALLHNN